MLLERLPGFSLDAFQGAQVPVTPVQEQILRSGNLSWVAAEIRLPVSAGITLESIQDAWNVVASRNDILRTSVRFAFSPNYFLAQGDIADVLLHDHSLDRCADLGSAHLIVIQQAPEKFRIILHMPELFIDERSLRLIEHDLALCQSGATLVARSPSPDPFFSYVTEVHTRDIDASRAHWKAVLAGVLSARSPFPIAPAPTELTQTRRELVIDAGQEALLRLRVFADEYATGDIFTVLQATWALVLGTHMGIDDVTFAVILRDTCSSVDRRQTVVGRMDITFPTHARVDRGAPLVALFESLKHAQYQGEQHGYIGFDRILEQWDVSRPSIFSALRICGRGSHPTAPRLASEDGAFPLSLRFGILNSLRLDASFHSSLGEEHIHVLLDHFVAALNSLLSLNAFAAKAGDISLLSSAERAKVVDQAAPRAPMRRELIHRLIEARAAASPQVVAIEELEPWRAWTIGELNRFSNIVARNLGGYRKAVIPVCLDRSAYLVIALLAILKTGSAYGMLGFDVFLV